MKRSKKFPQWHFTTTKLSGCYSASAFTRDVKQNGATQQLSGCYPAPVFTRDAKQNVLRTDNEKLATFQRRGRSTGWVFQSIGPATANGLDSDGRNLRWFLSANLQYNVIQFAVAFWRHTLHEHCCYVSSTLYTLVIMTSYSKWTSKCIKKSTTLSN